MKTARIIRMGPPLRKLFLFLFLLFLIIFLLKIKFSHQPPKFGISPTHFSFLSLRLVEFLSDVEIYHQEKYLQCSRLPDADLHAFISAEREDDPRFVQKSSSCRVKSWNKVRTDTVPNIKLHHSFVEKKLGQKNYLYHLSPSPFSAFAYEEFIAVTLTAENQYGKPVFCRYYDCQRKEIDQPFESFVFPESTVYCGRRFGAEFISITETLRDTPDPPVVIQNRAVDIPKHSFTVCVSTLFGDDGKFLRIAELVEYYKLQGATFFHFYIRNISNYDRMILDDYVRTGDVEVIYLHDHWWRADFMWQQVQVNECHQRSKYFSKWTAFVDLDERIEMKNKSERIIDYLDSFNNPNVVNLNFPVQWVIKNELSPTQYISEHHLIKNLNFNKFTNTSTPAFYWLKPKCIIRPEKIASMDIHEPRAVYKGYWKTIVNSTIGVVRNYRNLSNGIDSKEDVERILLHTPFTQTQMSPPIEKILTKNILDRIKYVYDPVKFTCEEEQAIYQVHGQNASCYQEHIKAEEIRRKIDEQNNSSNIQVEERN